MALTQKNITEFIRFVVTSGFAALVNVVSRIGFSQIVSYEWAVFLAYLVGMLTAYILSRKYVFEASGRSVKREMTGFVIVNIVAVIQVWIVSVGLYKWFLPLIGWTFEPALVAHICGVVSPTFTSYFGHKYVSFGKQKAP
ncbi:MAG: GtrA family protein [Litorimonas sp.]